MGRGMAMCCCAFAIAGACKDKTPAESAPSPAPAVGSPTRPVQLHAGAPEAAALPDVPPLALAAVAPEQTARARDLNARGLQSHRKKDYPAAIAAYVDALQADPGHLLARYNLACVYALGGDAKRATALLRQFKTAGCVLCLKRLIRAQEDHDFDGVRSDPDFAAVVAGVSLKEPDYAAATKAAVAALRSGDVAVFEATIAAGRSIRVRIDTEDLSDGEGPPPKPQIRTLTSKADVDRFLDEIMEYEPVDEITCRGECCTMSGQPGDATVLIREICFWPEAGGGALVVSIELYGGGL